MKAAVFTIGNEVSSGQIVNGNAAWISQQLEDLKVEVSTHVTVQDEHSQILDALEFLGDAKLIFVTGGLGPTQDDLTRHSICQWLGDKLIYDESSWQRIVKRLNSAGVPVAESNRQQCYFPSNSQVLSNEAGTANGFYSQKGEQHIWCLPGPPREIRRIWDDHIAEQVKKLAGDTVGKTLRRWQCLGLSESALGELVEEAIAGSTLSSGYRPHIPYVEIKLWCQDNELDTNQAYVAAMEKAIKPWLVSREDEDIGQDLLKQLDFADSIKVFDFSGGSILPSRLGKAYRNASDLTTSMSIVSQWEHEPSPGDLAFKALELAAPEELTLALGPLNGQEWGLGLAYNGFIYMEQENLPFKYPQATERSFQYQIEASLQCWRQLLKKIEVTHAKT